MYTQNILLEKKSGLPKRKNVDPVFTLEQAIEKKIFNLQIYLLFKYYKQACIRILRPTSLDISNFKKLIQN
jgi:hypothetical protein